MKVLIDLCLVPLGGGMSLSKYVAACHEIIKAAGLKHQLHANGTNIEGDYDLVFQTVKKCHERVHEMGAPRIHTNIKMGTRTDRSQTMADKMDSVTQKLSKS
ncbi:MTH1187 family thiamine-binding protein [uncultured Desulfobacter sp.]|uniref:MTH1187 family thiamine-binding protein n=1 Tax=uncultured Desulfobacter sp. TaxID=240139 RepID=UPI002AAB5865|nr:MTH1187 family thiamine-binding protein [uncultured Desulfobacter sp.]